jgi:hypothetical protein
VPGWLSIASQPNTLLHRTRPRDIRLTGVESPRTDRLLRLGKKGIAKQIFLGTRDLDDAIDYLAAFVALARDSDWGDAKSPFVGRLP